MSYYQKVLILGILLLVFTLGWFSSDVLSFSNLQEPFGMDTKEKSSPGDWIKENEIFVFDDKVVLNIENAVWSKFTDTNSMDPLLDVDANAIEIEPSSASQIRVGDIVAYNSNKFDTVIIHRVVDKGYDKGGAYFILKGDNNSYEDPEKVRFNQIERVLVAIIY